MPFGESPFFLSPVVMVGHKPGMGSLVISQVHALANHYNGHSHHAHAHTLGLDTLC